MGKYYGINSANDFVGLLDKPLWKGLPFQQDVSSDHLTIKVTPCDSEEIIMNLSVQDIQSGIIPEQYAGVLLAENFLERKNAFFIASQVAGKTLNIENVGSYLPLPTISSDYLYTIIDSDILYRFDSGANKVVAKKLPDNITNLNSLLTAKFNSGKYILPDDAYIFFNAAGKERFGFNDDAENFLGTGFSQEWNLPKKYSHWMKLNFFQRTIRIIDLEALEKRIDPASSILFPTQDLSYDALIYRLRTIHQVLNFSFRLNPGITVQDICGKKIDHKPADTIDKIPNFLENLPLTHPQYIRSLSEEEQNIVNQFQEENHDGFIYAFDRNASHLAGLSTCILPEEYPVGEIKNIEMMRVFLTLHMMNPSEITDHFAENFPTLFTADKNYQAFLKDFSLSTPPTVEELKKLSKIYFLAEISLPDISGNYTSFPPVIGKNVPAGTKRTTEDKTHYLTPRTIDIISNNNRILEKIYFKQGQKIIPFNHEGEIPLILKKIHYYSKPGKKYFNSLAESLKEARLRAKSVADKNIENIVKQGYSQFIVMLTKKTDTKWYRPDWAAFIIQEANINFFNQIAKSPYTPLAIHTDCAYYLTNNNDISNFIESSNFNMDSRRLGSMKKSTEFSLSQLFEINYQKLISAIQEKDLAGFLNAISGVNK